MRIRLIVAGLLLVAGAVGTWWILQSSNGGAIIFGISMAALALATVLPSPGSRARAKASKSDVSPAVYAATRGVARPGGPGH